MPIRWPLDEIDAVGPGGHFFGTARTIATYETAFYRPLISTTQNYGAWMEAGGKMPPSAPPAIWQEALEDLCRTAASIPASARRLRPSWPSARKRAARRSIEETTCPTNFPHLFKPLQLRHKTLRNRIVFGAHTANMSDMGLPGERHRGYYEERARGGAAMIVVEPVPVHRTAVLTRGNFRHSTDEIIPHFRKITDAVHAHGAVICHQLYHVGQHGDFDNSFEPNWSPSGLPSFHDSDGSHAMTEAEIEEIIEGFVQAARRAKESGFDGIELFAAYNASSTSSGRPSTTAATTTGAAAFENRMRFSRRDHARASARWPARISSSAWPSTSSPRSTVSPSIETMQEIVAWHDERQLMDYVTCGTGSYFDFTRIIPTFLFADKLGAPYAEALKQVVKHAKVQCESHVRTPENADYVVASGQADMVSIVRGQIADPHLANKAKEGRPEDIRPCLSCNQMCWGRRSRDYWISCLINPSAGREFEWGGDRFTPAAKPKNVLVVGGGVRAWKRRASPPSAAIR